MHHCVVRFLRVLPRDKIPNVPVKAQLPRFIPREEQPTVVGDLLARQEASRRWPQNLRIELPTDKTMLKGIPSGRKKRLLKLLKET